MAVRMESGWKQVLSKEFEKQYFRHLTDQIKYQKQQGVVIFPPSGQIFNAFELTPWDQLKVVLLGQDPYHGLGEAMGLCFSVPKGIKIPPSLKNIYKEIQNDLNLQLPLHGDLSFWAQQGVLLLNASLTVIKDQPNSHKDLGWHQFTDAVIQTINDKKEGIVFLLWGNYAKSKSKLIDKQKHFVLESSHPSPLAGNGFFGNHHFSLTNEFLNRTGKQPINWQIS